MTSSVDNSESNGQHAAAGAPPSACDACCAGESTIATDNTDSASPTNTARPTDSVSSVTAGDGASSSSGGAGAPTLENGTWHFPKAGPLPTWAEEMVKGMQPGIVRVELPRKRNNFVTGALMSCAGLFERYDVYRRDNEEVCICVCVRALRACE